MPVTLIVKAEDELVSHEQRMVAGRVLEHLESDFPDLRLLIFLDDVVWQEFRNDSGVENRGLFHPINEHYYPKLWWPPYLREDLLMVDSTTLETGYRVDGIVYLHGDTCEQEASLTTTLAHELQHFIQYGTDRTMWAWNQILVNCKYTIDRAGLTWRDIPMECEARIVAKRISAATLGLERTAEYITFRQNQARTPRDAADWHFIQGIDTEAPYDWRSETRKIFRRLGQIDRNRQEMTCMLDMAREMPDYRNLDLNDIIERQK